MCGIAGLIDNSHKGALVVANMLAVQAHRGPDGGKLWTSDDGRVHLGHRRLAILDLSAAGAQPMTDTTGRYVLTYNGEIYNYREIRLELKALGHTFNTESDTEVIIAAYKEWGVESLHRFNGMFAFALYDQKNHEIFFARDRYGEKPLLFSANKNFFAFASEYKALLANPAIGRDYDHLRLFCGIQNTSKGLDSERQTVFNDIQQLEPSHAMIVNVRSLKHKIWRYWDVSLESKAIKLSHEEARANFKALLQDSIRLRLRSDVIVGSCLSGGLDSGAIVSIVTKVLQPEQEYHTFTGRFPGSAADEWNYAEKVVKDTGVISHTVVPTPERLADEIGEFIRANELPVGSSSQYAQYCVFRLAKEQGVTVLLDGQGADELLGGYETYFRYYIQTLSERNDKTRLTAEEKTIRERYPTALKSAGASIKEKLPLKMRKFISKAFGFGTSLQYGVKSEFAAQLETYNKRNTIEGVNPLTSALYQDSFGMFLTTLLRYGDRNSMAHSREVRLPFCDHRIAEFVLTLPPEYLMGEAQTKRLLRDVMKGVLHEDVRTRWRKNGFLPPQSQWFRGPLLEMASDLLHSQSFLEDQYWDAKWWHVALKRMRKGDRTLGWVLWQPFISEVWKKEFVKA